MIATLVSIIPMVLLLLGMVTQFAGVFLLIVFVSYTIFLFRTDQQAVKRIHASEADDDDDDWKGTLHSRQYWKPVLLTVGGLAAMAVGGPALVEGANTHQAKGSSRSSEQALRGIEAFLASIHGTAFHTATDDVKEFLLCKRPMHRQEDARRDLLHKMTSLDQTAVRIAPTASNGEPMLHDHGHQFGIDLTEDAHALLAAPAIHLAVLFP